MTELKASFDLIADAYDRYRDGYDPHLIADIRHITGLGKDAVVCEIGAGTGQASIDLASGVSKLVCIEPGSNLAVRLRRNLSNYDNVEILNSTFEDAELEVARFDLVFAAQSFHWLDSAVRYQKIFEVLKPGGWFAAFWKRWIPSSEEGSSVTTKLFQEYLSDYSPLSPHQHELNALSDFAGIVESELFARCQLRRYPALKIPDVRSPEDQAESIRTWSSVAALEKTQQNKLIDRLAEIFRHESPKATDETILIIGQKRDVKAR